MPMRIVQVLEAKVKVTVVKTRKTYYRTMKYAKHVMAGPLEGPEVHQYFLRERRGWRRVSEGSYKKAISDAAVQLIHRQLGKELRERVEKEMGVER